MKHWMNSGGGGGGGNGVGDGGGDGCTSEKEGDGGCGDGGGGGGLLSGVEVVVQRESANHPGRQSSERSSGGVSASER